MNPKVELENLIVEITRRCNMECEYEGEYEEEHEEELCLTA